MNKDQNKKIDEILSSLDNCQRASLPDFFYTRLKARMEKGMEVKSVTQRPLVLRPIFALTALAAVIIINAFVIFQKDDKSNIDNNTALSEAESLQSIAAEYSLNDNNTALFDINQEK
jgi:hypothetical protein